MDANISFRSGLFSLAAFLISGEKEKKFIICQLLFSLNLVKLDYSGTSIQGTTLGLMQLSLEYVHVCRCPLNRGRAGVC